MREMRSWFYTLGSFIRHDYHKRYLLLIAAHLQAEILLSPSVEPTSVPFVVVRILMQSKKMSFYCSLKEFSPKEAHYRN